MSCVQTDSKRSYRCEHAEQHFFAVYLPRFGAVLRALGGRLARLSDRARQRQALAELDDRLLRDIGVTSDAAAREAAKPFWRD